MTLKKIHQEKKALVVHKRMVQVFGARRRHSHPDAVEVLVSTILSQNTNDGLRDKAFRSLRSRFPSWAEVRDAPEDQVAEAIQIAGLSKQKAPAIQRALRRIHAESGEWSLDFLRDMTVQEAKQWLTAIKGVGPKTAAIVLLFALEMPAFPVDTHIHRVSKRLGLIPANASRGKAHDLLEAMLPPSAYVPAHLNLIRHGREVCQARKPRCEVCVLRDLCEYYRIQARPATCPTGRRRAATTPPV
jgi:endonuclease-3